MSFRSRRKKASKGVEIKPIRYETQTAVWYPPSSPYDDPVYTFIRADLTVEDLATFSLEKERQNHDPRITPQRIYQKWLRSMGWQDEDDEMDSIDCDEEIVNINHRRVRFADEMNKENDEESPLVFSPPNFSPQEDSMRPFFDIQMGAVTDFFPSLAKPAASIPVPDSSPSDTLNINPNPFLHFSVLNKTFSPPIPPTVDNSSTNTFFYNTPLIRAPSLSPEPKRVHLVTEQPHSAFHRVIPMDEMILPATLLDPQWESSIDAPSINSTAPEKDQSTITNSFFIPMDIIETLAQIN